MQPNLKEYKFWKFSNFQKLLKMTKHSDHQSIVNKCAAPCAAQRRNTSRSVNCKSPVGKKLEGGKIKIKTNQTFSPERETVNLTSLLNFS